MARLTRVLAGTALAVAATAIVTPAAAADGPRSGETTNTRPAETCVRAGVVYGQRATAPVAYPVDGCAGDVARLAETPSFTYSGPAGVVRVGDVPDRQCVTTQGGAPGTRAVNGSDRIVLLYNGTNCRGVAKVVFPDGEFAGAFQSLLFLSIPR
ncbi:hypothetical protein V5P93_003179 [Actinokineospora auranticolor]|uniref:Peptidase inhibitor family I36 n=1 Tax=Actinokineospora auranticolor TaxID=155976 RepID=A0A2S6H1H0_9PSEU|nr:hypothetical protein [Actinokineospora auranticolor]PPK71313.1 hypothetical protein CLV40_101502 [Actinokineospora auranticolor]